MGKTLELLLNEAMRAERAAFLGAPAIQARRRAETREPLAGDPTSVAGEEAHGLLAVRRAPF
jgi:hypothetical protein